MIYMGNKADSPEEGMQKARAAIEDGSALNKFRDMIAGQGGDPGIIENYSLMPQADFSLELEAWEEGYIEELDAMKIGLASQHTGAGRERKEDEIDMSAGILFYKKRGDHVTLGENICKIFGNDMKKLHNALEEIRIAVKIGSEKSEKAPLIKKMIK